VTVAEDEPRAQVHCTARLTIAERSEPPSVDAREVMIDFEKVGDTWVVSAVRPVETLVR
jgi:hypothetical protein